MFDFEILSTGNAFHGGVDAKTEVLLPT